MPDPLAKVQPAHDDLVEIPAEELAQFPGQMHPGELLGCYFFNMNGRCAKPDNRCAFPHVLTRWVAAWYVLFEMHAHPPLRAIKIHYFE